MVQSDDSTSRRARPVRERVLDLVREEQLPRQVEIV
jgi:hypothetical protein